MFLVYFSNGFGNGLPSAKRTNGRELFWNPEVPLLSKNFWHNLPNLKGIFVLLQEIQVFIEVCLQTIVISFLMFDKRHFQFYARLRQRGAKCDMQHIAS